MEEKEKKEKEIMWLEPKICIIYFEWIEGKKEKRIEEKTFMLRAIKGSPKKWEG